MVLRALHLCSGYGGFELALRLAGVDTRTVAHVERDAYAAATLVARMEEAHLDQAPIWSDLTTFDGRPWRGRVDLITAGFPCQPFSAAGQQRGVDDERWLWPAIGRLISDVGPSLVYLENVPGLVRAGLPHVLSDLAELGFDAEWGLLSAAEVGAPHKRERIWLLAHTTGIDEREPDYFERTVARQRARRDAGWGGINVADTAGRGRAQARRHDAGDCPAPRLCGLPNDAQRSSPDAWPPGRDDTTGWNRWIAAGGPEPAVRRGADGRPAELADALHLGGNGLVPAVAATALVELARRLDITLPSVTARTPNTEPDKDTP